jgi:phage/plasmid-associated DNA primase
MPLRREEEAARFVEACVMPAPNREVQAREMYQVYLDWARANGAAALPMSGKMFGRIMVGMLDQELRRNVRFYVNVRLRV